MRVTSSSLADARALAQPPGRNPAVTDHLYRRASIYLSVPLARLGVAPNAITVGWITLGLVGIGGLAVDDALVRLAGALLLQVAYLLDYADGEVARLCARKSRAGELLDLLGHGLHKATLPIAVAWTASGSGIAPGYLLAGALGAAAIVIGDAVRFYAACVGGHFAPGDVGHGMRTHVRAAGRRLAPGTLLYAAYRQSFESPGVYGLAVVAALTGLWAPLALYWAAVGPVWLVLRTVAYARHLDTPGAGDRAPNAATG